MIQHTNTLRIFFVSLGVGRKDKYGKSNKFLKERQQQKLGHCENSFFFLLQTYSQNMGQKFSFLTDNTYFKCT